LVLFTLAAAVAAQKQVQAVLVGLALAEQVKQAWLLPQMLAL
jgi:hypothetical protein